MEHVCSNERKVTVKTWQPKPKKSDGKEAISKAVPVEDKEDAEKITSENEVKNDLDEGKWTEIKRKKDEGKNQVSPGTNLFFSNVFEPLGVLNDPKDTPLGVT